MLAWRRGQPALRMGSVRFFKTAEPVLAFRRTGPDGMIVCVFNLSASGVVVKLRELALAADAPEQDARIDRNSLHLGPNGFAFLVPTGRADDARVVFKS
jgi:alpha-glucosidase